MSRTRAQHLTPRAAVVAAAAAALLVLCACDSPTGPIRFGAATSNPTSDGELAVAVGDTLSIFTDVIAISDDETALCESGEPGVAQIVDSHHVVAIAPGVAPLWCTVTHRPANAEELANGAEPGVASYFFHLNVQPTE